MYAAERAKAVAQEKLFRVYVSDSLQAIGMQTGRYLSYRWKDAVDGSIPSDAGLDFDVDSVVDDIVSRAGLEVVG